MPLGIAISCRQIARWFRYGIGDHAWKTEPEGYHFMSLGRALLLAAAYRNCMGRDLAPGTGIAWAVPQGMLRSCPSGGGGYSGESGGLSDTCLCCAMHMAPPELVPAAVWEFNRRFLPDKLTRLSCRDLALAFANYPLNVQPVHPEKIMPKVLEDRRKGAYIFRDHFGTEDDFVTHLFLRSESPAGPAYFHNQAGSFRISGLGTAWAVGAPGDKRNWLYANENVLEVNPSPGQGLGRMTYFTHKPDGSGVVGADMSHVYNRKTGGWTMALGAEADRHFAVDYGGSCGSPALFAVVDRVRGGGHKAWILHTGGSGIGVEGRTFTIRGAEKKRGGRGPATLRGWFVAPDELEVTASGSTIRAVSFKKNVDYFVVMTVQRGRPPQLDAAGEGLDAVVRVGKQEVRFRDGKLVLKD